MARTSTISIIYLVALTLFMPTACQRELNIQDDTPILEKQVAEETDYTFSCHASWEPETKANILNEDTSLADFKFVIFSNGEHIYTGNSAVAGANTTRLNKYGIYSIYAWSAVKNDELSDSATLESESSLSTEVAPFTASQSFWNSLSKIPIAGSVKNMTGLELDMLDGIEDGKISIPLDFLMAKVNLSIDFDDLVKEMFSAGMTGSVNITSVKLGGIVKNVGLFDSEYNSSVANAAVIIQDTATSSSLDGASYVIYIPEHLGGTLLPDNTDPTQKTPSALTAVGQNPDNFPFIEVTVNFSSIIMTSTATYRFYPGKDASSNFDIERNKVYDVSLHIDYDSITSTFTGLWKLSATPAYLDEMTLSAHPSDVVYRGETVTFKHSYKTATDDLTSLYTQPGGYAIGQDKDMESYVSSGTLPSGYSVISPDYDMIQCVNCGVIYHNVPRASRSAGRQAWLDANLDNPGSTGVYKCKWCGSVLLDYSSGSVLGGSAEWGFNQGVVGGTGKIYPITNARVALIPYSEPWVTFTVPGTAAYGDVLHFVSATRDGRLTSGAELVVAKEGAPVAERTKSGDIYIAQRDTINITSWPSGVYGSDPEFYFSSSNTNIFEVTKISKRQAVVSASKPASGSANVQIKSSASGPSLVDIPINVVKPSIYIKRSNNLSVQNGGVEVSCEAPQYYKGSGATRELYTDYENDLYGVALGEPELYSVEKGFIGFSNALSNGKPIHKMWLDKANISGYLFSFGNELDNARWRSPKCTDLTFVEPVCFEGGTLNNVLGNSVLPYTSRLEYTLTYNSQYATTLTKRYPTKEFSVPSAIDIPQLKLTGNSLISEKRNAYAESSTVELIGSAGNKYTLNLSTTPNNGYYIDYYYNIKGKNPASTEKINFFRLNVYAHYQAKYLVTTENLPQDLYMRGHLEHRSSTEDHWYDINESRWPLYHVDVQIVPSGASVEFMSRFKLPNFDEKSGDDFVYYPKRHHIKDNPDGWFYLKNSDGNIIAVPEGDYPFWATGTYYYNANKSIEENCNFLAVRNSRYRLHPNGITSGYRAVIDRMWYRPIPDDYVVQNILVGLIPFAPWLYFAINNKSGTLIHTKYGIDTFKADNKPMYMPKNEGEWVTDTYYSDRIATRNDNLMQVYSLPNYWDEY